VAKNRGSLTAETWRTRLDHPASCLPFSLPFFTSQIQPTLFLPIKVRWQASPKRAEKISLSKPKRGGRGGGWFSGGGRGSSFHGNRGGVGSCGGGCSRRY